MYLRPASREFQRAAGKSGGATEASFKGAIKELDPLATDKELNDAWKRYQAKKGG